VNLKKFQRGFMNGGMLVILIGGLMIGWLFFDSYSTGKDLPLWPAIAVILVNLLGIWKLLSDRRRRNNPRPPRDGGES
jgi:hypothetical protein